MGVYDVMCCVVIHEMVHDRIFDMIYNMMWYNMIWYDMIWNDMIWYDMIRYDMIRYMIWYIWYDMIYDMICDIWYDVMWYDMIYLLTAVGLPPGVSSTVHIYTQTVQSTFIHKQYTERYNETLYTERNIHNNKNYINITIKIHSLHKQTNIQNTQSHIHKYSRISTVCVTEILKLIHTFRFPW